MLTSKKLICKILISNIDQIYLWLLLFLLRDPFSLPYNEFNNASLALIEPK